MFQTTTDANTTTVNTAIGTSAVYSGGSTAKLQAGSTNAVTVNSGNAGANPGVSINGTVGAGSTSHTGVLITGSGQNGTSYTNSDRAAGTIPSWSDVAIQSKSYGLGDPTLGSAILVTDYGVQILSPQPIAGQKITNNTGNNTSSGTIVNNNGLNSGTGANSGTVVNNNGGITGDGNTTNNIGMNSSSDGGTATNNIGGVSGNGTVTNGFGNNTSTTGGIANNSIGMNSGNGQTNNSIGGSSGSGNTTNTIGQNNGTGTMTNNFGGGSGATANNFGNANPNTTINSTAGSSTMNMKSGEISMVGSTTENNHTGSPGLATNGTTGTTSAIGSGGVSVYGTAKTIAPNTTINNQLDGKLYQNKINGNLFVDGNVYINGTLDYVASASATTTVVGGGVSTSILTGATRSVTGSTGIVMKGTNTPHIVVDGNGKLLPTSGVADQSSAGMVLTNGYGNTHGIIINERQTTISGGVYSSSMTLNDFGARFSNSANGNPITVTGVADGRSDFDAVNFRQLRNIAASTAAMANLPGVDPNKNFSLGLGVGHHEGGTAFAFGMGYRPFDNAMVRASVASGMNGYSKSTYGVGASLSW